MPTFRFNSERPYYQDGRLMKKVTTQHNLRLSTFDCALLGFSAARLLGRLALSLLFKRNPYRLS
jgi:ABC-type molybdate transport system ATPase subunit